MYWEPDKECLDPEELEQIQIERHAQRLGGDWRVPGPHQSGHAGQHLLVSGLAPQRQRVAKLDRLAYPIEELGPDRALVIAQGRHRRRGHVLLIEHATLNSAGAPSARSRGKPCRIAHHHRRLGNGRHSLGAGRGLRTCPEAKQIAACILEMHGVIGATRHR